MPDGCRIFLFLGQAFEAHSYPVSATLYGWPGYGCSFILRVRSLLIASEGVNQVIPLGPRFKGLKKTQHANIVHAQGFHWNG
jgi:hypothetical protein